MRAARGLPLPWCCPEPGGCCQHRRRSAMGWCRLCRVVPFPWGSSTPAAITLGAGAQRRGGVRGGDAEREGGASSPLPCSGAPECGIQVADALPPAGSARRGVRRSQAVPASSTAAVHSGSCLPGLQGLTSPRRSGGCCRTWLLDAVSCWLRACSPGRSPDGRCCPKAGLPVPA